MTNDSNDGDEGDDIKKLHSITKQTYRDQAIWFLNHHTDSHHDLQLSEIVFKVHKKCLECDEQKKSGHAISELDAHLILEFIGKPVTQSAFRKYFLEIDQSLKISVPLVIILFFYFDADWKVLVNQSECYNGLELDAAKDSLLQAQTKLQGAIDAQKKSSQEAEEADVAMENSRRQQEILSKAIMDCRMEEESFAEAKKQAEEALEQVTNQESKAHQKKEELDSIVNYESNGIVTKNKAKAELKIMEYEDPLPLRKARLKNENAVKNLRKSTNASKQARVAAEDAKEKTEKAMDEASVAKEKATNAAKIAEATIPKARDAIEDLKVLIDELMKNLTLPWGSLFYIDREVKEAESFLPKEKLKRLKEAAEENKKRISTPPRKKMI